MNQASIFTIEKQGDHYKDIVDFPKDLYVDTSGWVRAYGSSNGYRTLQAKEFLGDCVQDGVTLYHSGMVLSEAVHVNQNAYIDGIVDQLHVKVPKYHDGGINRKRLYDILQDSI